MTEVDELKVQLVTKALNDLVTKSKPASILAEQALRQWEDNLLPRFHRDHAHPIRDSSDPDWTAFLPKFLSPMLDKPSFRMSVDAIEYLQAHIAACLAVDTLDLTLSGDIR